MKPSVGNVYYIILLIALLAVSCMPRQPAENERVFVKNESEAVEKHIEMDLPGMDGCYIYEAVIDGRHRYFASLLPHDTVFSKGMLSEAIMGEFINGPNSLTPEDFQQNTQFLKFLAYVISKHAIDCPELVTEAELQQNGYV